MSKVNLIGDFSRYMTRQCPDERFQIFIVIGIDTIQTRVVQFQRMCSLPFVIDLHTVYIFIYLLFLLIFE